MASKAKPTRILGIDPGTNILGYAVIDAWKEKYQLIDMGVVSMGKTWAQQKKLSVIFHRLVQIIIINKPECMAIEAPFYGKNVQSMLKLGRAQGVAMAAGLSQGLDIEEYSPRKIKQSICGNGNASKEQVASMLSHLMQHPVTQEPLDATDALATALCHHFQSSSPLSAPKHYNGWEAFIKANKNRTG
jgi:crossover junction endodeoxyribonuclease RuvC